MIAFNDTFPGSQVTPPQGDEQEPRLFRVCHLSMGLCTGGLERLLVDFARYHDPNRFELTFVALDKVARPAEEIRQLGCNVKVIPNFGKNWQQFGVVKVAKEVWSEIKIRKIRRVIKSWPFRVDLMVKELGFQIEHFSQ